ncbi:MAG: hypothetical protein DMF61_11660 [Blastocatellia bacterium AA13]|nr:MAG: hypothetical protein DMF61_11660 [Blastocatellia bacterium AA13]
MSTPGRQSWFGTAILISVLYSAIGILFALPSNQVRVWRLAAWVISAALFAAHIGYEQFRLGGSTRATALHTTLAVAIGAFGLAVAANVHEVWVASSYRRSLALALVAWPALTAVPAFVAALIAAAVLARIRRST